LRARRHRRELSDRGSGHRTVDFVVAPPVQQSITRYFEATGNAAAINQSNLVARVQA